MNKVLTALLPVVILSAACAPLPYQRGAYPGPYARVNPYPSRYAPAEASGAEVVGRWDNVMLLPAGTRVQVLMMDGIKAGGELASANVTTLRVLTASGQVELEASEVMRVDRLPQAPSRAYGEAAARGAAVGAGIVGVMGLLVGHMPPARIFAAGAIMGAAGTVQDASYVRGPVMIYLAPRRPHRS